jgi:hypothetical protein
LNAIGAVKTSVSGETAGMLWGCRENGIPIESFFGDERRGLPLAVNLE